MKLIGITVALYLRGVPVVLLSTVRRGLPHCDGSRLWDGLEVIRVVDARLHNRKRIGSESILALSCDTKSPDTPYRHGRALLRHGSLLG